MEGYLPVISIWWLLSVGVALLVLEVLLAGTFVVMWFGIAAIIVALAGLWIDFPAGEHQLIAIGVLGALLLWLLRRPMQRWLTASTETVAEDFAVGEFGELQRYEDGWRVFYQGTWWQPANAFDGMAAGQKVKVVAIRGNQVVIEPAPNT